MKLNERPDKRLHIRKKVAGGTTGAVLGAVVGGPVGALVGGVIGTVVGGAAESGKLSKLAFQTIGRVSKPELKAKFVMKRAASKVTKAKASTKKRSTSPAKTSRPKTKVRR